MSVRNCLGLLQATNEAGKLVCIGLDPSRRKLPSHIMELGDENDPRRHPLYLFNTAIIRATSDIAGAYKPNYGFYESWGWRGVRAMEDTIDFIRDYAPDIPVIADGKRGDVGDTSLEYGIASFDVNGVDALTVSPYVGFEAGLGPLIEAHPDKVFYVLCRTSNSGAGMLQDQIIHSGIPVWQYIAEVVAQNFNRLGNCGLVVGATYPGHLREVRRIVGPDMPILSPGLGKQGGVASLAVPAGRGLTVYNSSSSLIHAGNDRTFDTAARSEAQRMDREIRALLQTA